MKKNKFIFKEVTSHELYGVLQDFVGGFNIKEVYNVK